MTRASMLVRRQLRLNAPNERSSGFGSNLTLEGTVECDASIIDGKAQSFGSVGAVQGNPTLN